MSRPQSVVRRLPVAGLGLAAGALVVLGACGSSSHSGPSAAPGTTGAPASAAAGASGSGSAGTTGPTTAGVTIRAAGVGGYGQVLVNSSGRTLYILSSERGGKLTCTDANGCTKAWPDTELPDGVTSATAGPGVTASLLSTVKDAKGSLYVTYGGWPLYTFSGDSKAGQANGQGITSFGGTWYVLGASGQPVTSSSSSSSPSSSSSGGYHY